MTTKEVYQLQNNEGYIFINSFDMKGHHNDKLYSVKARNHNTGEYIAVEKYYIHEHNAINALVKIVQDTIGKF